MIVWLCLQDAINDKKIKVHLTPEIDRRLAEMAKELYLTSCNAQQVRFTKPLSYKEQVY